MKWASNIGYNKIEIIEDYDSFEKNIVESTEGEVDKDLSFAIIGDKKVYLKDIELLRKEDLSEQKINYPRDDNYSWWNGNGLYFKNENIFPGSKLNIYVKYFKKDI